MDNRIFMELYDDCMFTLGFLELYDVTSREELHDEAQAIAQAHRHCDRFALYEVKRMGKPIKAQWRNTDTAL